MSVPVPHESGCIGRWTAFSITPEVSRESDADAITELALKGTVTLPGVRI